MIDCEVSGAIPDTIANTIVRAKRIIATRILEIMANVAWRTHSLRRHSRKRTIIPRKISWRRRVRRDIRQSLVREIPSTISGGLDDILDDIGRGLTRRV